MVGYCWGGTVSWKAACTLSELACSVPYYGGGITNLGELKAKCPVMFHWGEQDHSIPLEKAKAFAQAHPEATHYFYPAGHGFNCDQRGSYDAASAQLARKRTLEFFGTHLG
jgi:carboxymethylenebutenolidase